MKHSHAVAESEVVGKMNLCADAKEPVTVEIKSSVVFNITKLKAVWSPIVHI